MLGLFEIFILSIVGILLYMSFKGETNSIPNGNEDGEEVRQRLKDTLKEYKKQKKKKKEEEVD